MHLTVECPRCQNRYQLDPGLRGKRMRCLNTICQTIFEVQPVGEPALAPPSPLPPTIAPQSEVSQPASAVATAPAPTSSWDQAPPPVRGQGDMVSATTATEDVPDLSSLEDEPATEEQPPPSSWDGDAPPVRRAEPVVPSASLPQYAPTVGAEVTSRSVRRGGRRYLLVAVVLLASLGLLAAGGIWLAGRRAVSDEAGRGARAEELYRNADYGEATAAWQQLQRDFPRSSDYARYGFLAELSAVRDAARSARVDAAHARAALRRTLDFLLVHQNIPHLAERRTDVFLTLERLTNDLTRFAEEGPDAQLLAAAREAWSAAAKFEAPPSVDLPQVQRHMTETFARLDKTRADRARYAHTLDQIKEYAARPTLGHYLAARTLIQQRGFAGQADLGQRLHALLAGVPGAVKFTPTLAPQPPGVEDDRLASLAVVPNIAGAGAASGGPDIVPVLARGVLYALDSADGRLRWARRLGIDAPAPLRLPADGFGPERLLAVASDTQTLLALDAASGQELWRCRLDDTPVGGPILLGRHVLLTTQSGRVEEIEVTAGRHTGHYHLNQRLVGGVHQPGTSLVYLAANHGGVFVLDVAKRQCVAVLLTDHEPGALQGPPQVLAGGEQGTLMLTLSHGAALELRGYALPIDQADAKPLSPNVKVSGQADFPAWHSGLQLALATDNGRLHLFGINQKGQHDPWLFPWLERDYVLEAAPSVARAQVVHVAGRDFWIAAGGRVHRLELIEHPKEGPKWLQRWPKSPNVGSLIQTSYAWNVEGQAGVLVLVTQATSEPTIRATALDSSNGTIRWQRQLGVTWTGTPLAQGAAVACPVAEGIVLLRPEAVKLGAVFADAGQLHLAPVYAGERRGLWPQADGWLEARWAPEGRLRWRRLGDKQSFVEASLSAPLAGAPLVCKEFFVAPLASGLLERVERGDSKTVNPGPKWRGDGAEEEHPCVGVALDGDGDEFITSNGRLGLTRWHWPQAKLTPRAKVTTEMDQRVVALALSRDGKQLAACDVGDQVTLLKTDGLELVRAWRMSGKITAGPFFLGPGLAVVIEGKRLVWLDESHDRPVWEYGFVAPVVGAPVWADNLVVVGDQAGSFVALDPASGRPAGPGYTLRANVAPATAPVSLGDGRLFVPLCDGTAILLPLDRLRDTRKEPRTK